MISIYVHLYTYTLQVIHDKGKLWTETNILMKAIP